MRVKCLFTLAKLGGLKLHSYGGDASTPVCIAETEENHTQFLLKAAVSSATAQQKVCRNISIIHGFLHAYFPFSVHDSAEMKYEAHPYNTSRGNSETLA